MARADSHREFLTEGRIRMKKARPRAVAGLCVTLLLIMLVLLVPAYALAHRVSPLPDTTQTQPVDTGQPMESGASATSRYWAGYLLLGIILCAIVYFITRGRAHRLFLSRNSGYFLDRFGLPVTYCCHIGLYGAELVGIVSAIESGL